MTDARKPFWVKCPAPDCRHCWPAVYLPMEMGKCAKLLARAACPKCGTAKGIQIAKQTDGVLEEANQP